MFTDLCFAQLLSQDSFDPQQKQVSIASACTCACVYALIKTRCSLQGYGRAVHAEWARQKEDIDMPYDDDVTWDTWRAARAQHDLDWTYADLRSVEELLELPTEWPL